MNNIYLNNPDPLLSNRGNYQFQEYQQTQPQNYYQMQEFLRGGKDWVAELDTLTKTLDQETICNLNNNQEYSELASLLQQSIQEEIVGIVKLKLNGNRDVVDNIKKQISLIKRIKEQTTEDQRKSMSELSDYMKNYSHLTFDEYKNIKTGKSQQGEPNIIE